MTSFTRYLTVTGRGAKKFSVGIDASSPIAIAQKTLQAALDLRYSPVLPAFLTPGHAPAEPPENIHSVTFLFACSPYKALGLIKTLLTAEELTATYFTEGLASILILNISIVRSEELQKLVGKCPLEHWSINDGVLDVDNVYTEYGDIPHEVNDIVLPTCSDPELSVYAEQIAASVSTLFSAYSVYHFEELSTLRQIVKVTQRLLDIRISIAASSPDAKSGLAQSKEANAIVSALVEISAALSYAVTQGTSGSCPILWSRSPFPHHSLLGIGGSVRALTRFTRYIESAFTARSAERVIKDQYSIIEYPMPARIPSYESGDAYRLTPRNGPSEYFDSGGDFKELEQVPLIAHFSLRHGFMESKFSVTAASEALTAETMPQWTLMTLSHEIMHSRVRTIFQALFGKSWDNHEYTLVSQTHFSEFAKWIETSQQPNRVTVESGLRNAILNFCCIMERSLNPVSENDFVPGQRVTISQLTKYYCKHKQLAIEVIVHFHDFYYSYAYHPKMYMMSLWASWLKVAAPFIRPQEYLVRSLSTVACGTGLEVNAAFDYAVEILLDSLDSLEASGIKSPIFAEIRDLSKSSETRAVFRPLYYLIDQIRLFFASPIIASKIDRLDDDPFADGSTYVDDYSASIYVFGEAGASISPIRYSLSTLYKSLSGQTQAADRQWLTAWNYMVISS